jgi:integrase/recombinase XerD
MHVREAIGLDRPDVDVETGCMTVRGDTFGATREIPLHHSTLRALEEDCRVRDQRFPQPSSPSFFLSTAGSARS